MALKGKIIYLPCVNDPKKVREGINEIIYLVRTQGLKPKPR
jgi:hypothetical protein